MNLFLFFLNAVNLTGQGVLHLYFVCRFTGKPLKAGPLVLYLACLALLESLPSLPCFPDFGAAGPAEAGREGTGPLPEGGGAGQNLLSVGTAFGEFAALFGICRLFLGNSRDRSLITALLAFYVSQLSMGIVNSLESLIFPGLVGKRILYALVLLAAFASLALCAGCYLIILRWFAFQQGETQPSLWILLPSCLFFFAAERFVLHAAYGRLTVSLPTPEETGMHLILLVLQVLGLSALLSTLFACQRLRRGFQAQAALAAMSREVQAQRTYVAQAQMRYEKTRGFRHDITSHLSVLDGLLKEGRIRQARAYLQKLRAVTSDLSFPFRTGNPVVDIVLGDKLQLAHSEGIRTEVSLTLPAQCRADDLDLCVIFANALDNALRACQKVKQNRDAEGPKAAGSLGPEVEDPFLRISGCQQGDFYMLEFENSCLPGPSPKPGTGLSNIKAVAKRYGGTMAAQRPGCRFRLSVLLNISRHPEPTSVQTP